MDCHGKTCVPNSTACLISHPPNILLWIFLDSGLQTRTFFNFKFSIQTDPSGTVLDANEYVFISNVVLYKSWTCAISDAVGVSLNKSIRALIFLCWINVNKTSWTLSGYLIKVISLHKSLFLRSNNCLSESWYFCI